MIGISQIATRIDSLLQNEQDNRVFVTETLRQNALKILDTLMPRPVTLKKLPLL